ncbi:hypothetical protein ACFQ4M_16695, partial [Thauera mechernichensis]
SEELAATAEELGGQAGQLQELMGFFSVGSDDATSRRSTARKPAAAVSPPSPAPTASDSAPRRNTARTNSRLKIGKSISFSESDFEKF